MFGRIVVAIGAALAVAGPAVANADTTLGTVTCFPQGGGATGCSGLSGYRDALVWTRYDAASGLYRLVGITAPGAAARVLPVAGRREPFNADVGPDGAGRAVAVYARCAGDPGAPAKGCGLFKLDLASGRESRMLAGVAAGSPAAVSIWRDDVVFTGTRAGDGLRHPTLCLVAKQGASCHTLPAGPAGGRPTAASTGVQRMDLRAHTLAYSWYSNPGKDGMIRQTRILLIRDVRHPGRAPVLIAEAGAGGAGNAAVYSPSLDGTGLYYARGGATCDYRSAPTRLGRYDLAGTADRELAGPFVHAVARWEGSLTVERCPSFGPPTPTATTIVRLDPDPFAAAPPALRARACPARTSRARGWTAPRTVARPGANAALASRSDGTLALAAGSDKGLTISIRRAGARAFRTLAVLGGANAGGAQIAFAGDGSMVAAWEVSARTPSGVGYIRAVTSDRSGRFGAIQTLRTITGVEANAAHALRLAVNREGVAVASWSVASAIEASVRPAGGRFGPVQTVWTGSEAEHSYSAGLGIDDRGAAFIAFPVYSFQVSTSATTRLLTSRLSPGGSFSAASVLATGTGSLRAASVAIEGDGRGVVAWIASAGRSLRAMVALRSPDGTLGGPVQVSPPEAAVSSVPPAVAVAGGRAIVAVTEQQGAVSRVLVAVLGTTGSLSRAAMPAYTSTTGAIDVALAPRGDAAVAWEMRCGRAGD